MHEYTANDIAGLFYYDGALVRDDPGRALLNRGLQYGDGVFETMRAYDGRLFQFGEHMHRLRRGLEVLKIRWEGTDASIRGAVDAVLRGNGLQDACVKVIAFRAGGAGPTPPEHSRAVIVTTVRPFEPARKAAHEQGVSAHVVSVRRNTLSQLTFIKSLSYVENILGRIEAYEHNADEALFLNIHDRLAEGATSNIFMAAGGRLYTPPVSAGILNGVTRSAVMRIAIGLGIPCREEPCLLSDALQAEEAFLTNALMEIMPLLMIGGRQIGDGKPGRLTLSLMQCYNRLVQKELNESYRRPL